MRKFLSSTHRDAYNYTRDKICMFQSANCLHCNGQETPCKLGWGQPLQIQYKMFTHLRLAVTLSLCIYIELPLTIMWLWCVIGLGCCLYLVFSLYDAPADCVILRLYPWELFIELYCGNRGSVWRISRTANGLLRGICARVGVNRHCPKVCGTFTFNNYN